MHRVVQCISPHHIHVLLVIPRWSPLRCLPNGLPGSPRVEALPSGRVFGPYSECMAHRLHNTSWYSRTSVVTSMIRTSVLGSSTSLGVLPLMCHGVGKLSSSTILLLRVCTPFLWNTQHHPPLSTLSSALISHSVVSMPWPPPPPDPVFFLFSLLMDLSHHFLIFSLYFHHFKGPNGK